MNQIAVRDERTLAIEQKINQQVSSAISVGVGGITFQNAGEVMEFAKMMAVSGSAVPKHLRGQPGACLGIIDDAIRFQMSPYALARKSYFVNDNLAYEAQVIAGIINAFAPLKERPNVEYTGEGSDRKCIVTFKFKDGAVRTYESPKFKDIHPKNSPLWKSDPDQQQAYYSLRACARRHCSEVILGIYDVEEIRSIEHQESEERPSLADRLSAARASQGEAAQAREGFDADFVRSETAALSGGAEIERETSDAPLSSDEDSDGNPAPQPPPVAAGPSADPACQNPGEAAPEAGDLEADHGDTAVPASEPFNEPIWLRDFAKLIVASIGPDEAVVVNSSKGMFRDDLSEEARTKAKAIINYARAACRGELEIASAREIIAGKAGVEEKDLA